MTTATRPVALVTGASSGIGEAIALRLAQEGFDLVLVARSDERLQRVASSIQRIYGRRSWVLLEDLTRRDCGTALLQQVQALGITVEGLINNAGIGAYGPFQELPLEEERSAIAVNIGALVELTHAFLPELLARRSGAVINIASTAAFQPAPFMAVYAATKAFVLSFTEALWAETLGRGVKIIAVCPPAVQTPFIAKLGPNGPPKISAFAHGLPAEQVASAVVEAMRGDVPTYIVGRKSRILTWLVRLMPRAAVARSVARVMRPR
jgi:uncharacterized protein